MLCFVKLARCWQQSYASRHYVWSSSPGGSTEDEVASMIAGLLCFHEHK